MSVAADDFALRTDGPTQENRNRAELQLLRRCQQLSASVADLTIEAAEGHEPAGVTLIGRGTVEILAGLSRLAPKARRTVWNIQPSLPFDPEDRLHPLDERSKARGVDLQLITSQYSVNKNPLLTSTHPTVLVGPVHVQTILIDQACAVVAGPSTPSGDGTAWLVTQTDLVAAIARIWLETRHLSRVALPEGVPSPLTKRQCAVARRMAAGAKDSTIARELGVSARTIVTEVEAVFQLLGTTSRCEAGLLMRGGSPYGRALLAP